MQEELIKRLQELELQMQSAQVRLNQAIADIQAIGGAIHEVKYWIDKTGKKPETEADT